MNGNAKIFETRISDRHHSESHFPDNSFLDSPVVLGSPKLDVSLTHEFSQEEWCQENELAAGDFVTHQEVLRLATAAGN